RAVEPELIPCMRKYGIALYAFQPLAGGFLTSRYRRNMAEDDYEPDSRFDPNKFQGKLHHTRYVNDLSFHALEVIQAEASKHGLTEAECALRWLVHHSVLDAALGDKIIIGASRAGQLEENLVHLEKGPLPDDVVTAMENAYLRVKGVVPKYFH
ncbi:NADP-dependent oxidoreductase domain-containing protein, partial [Ilyonectria sp. MPI-CAGE-AT-0026]